MCMYTLLCSIMCVSQYRHVFVCDISELSDGYRLTSERGDVLKACLKVGACVKIYNTLK